MDNDIEALTKVVNFSGEQWKSLRNLLQEKDLLNSKEDGLLKVAMQIPLKIPTEKQCAALLHYDGFFGPGAGTFYLLAVTSMLGMTVINGMAYSRVLNLASNLISLLLFICLGKMVWTAGIAMSIGETIGVYAGSHFVYRNGAKLVKPLVVVACLLMALKSLYEAYFS